MALSRRVAATFLLMTMADFSDQLFDWQDRLFDNTNGRLEFRGNNWMALWPGTGKPGLWTTSISRMGALYSLIVREEEIYIAQRAHTAGREADDSAARDEDIALVIPPVFDGCTKVLNADEQKAARLRETSTGRQCAATRRRSGAKSRSSSGRASRSEERRVGKECLL